MIKAMKNIKMAVDMQEGPGGMFLDYRNLP